MPVSTFAEAQDVVLSGSYCCAFTCDRSQADYQMHTIAHLPELNAFVPKVEADGRQFLGVLVLSEWGPRSALLRQLDATELEILSAAYAGYIADILSKILQNSGQRGRKFYEVH